MQAEPWEGAAYRHRDRRDRSFHRLDPFRRTFPPRRSHGRSQLRDLPLELLNVRLQVAPDIDGADEQNDDTDDYQ